MQWLLVSRRDVHGKGSMDSRINAHGLPPQNANSVELIREPSPVVTPEFPLQFKAPHDFVDVLGRHHYFRVAAQENVPAS